MKLKYFLILALLSVLGQIIFSINYSIKIIDENIKINNQNSYYQTLFTKNQNLINTLSTINSIENINNLSKNKNYQDISKSINLNQ